MFETPEDLRELQELLDASYARAGRHLRSIWGEESRLDAREVCNELAGIQVLDLATVTPAGEPRVSPVDGFFYRGRFWFGSAESSLRFRNIRANPAVSAAVTRGLETFLVLVHGRAIEADPRGPDASVRVDRGADDAGVQTARSLRAPPVSPWAGSVGRSARSRRGRAVRH